MENYLEECGIFDNFYIPYLNIIKEKSTEDLSNYWFTETSGAVIDKILLQEKTKLVELCSRVLIKEFKLYQKEQGKVENTYKDFNEAFLDLGNIEKILSKYPVLKDLIEKEVRNVIRNLYDLFARLSQDKNEIEKIFGVKLGKLSSIDIGTGDTHNHGQSVAVLYFDNEKVIYKPHNLYPDIAYRKICDYLANQHIINIKYAKSISREKYGWQEWVEYQECTSKTMVHRYCKRMGGMLAVFRILKTTDMHMENIIPYGEFPVAIDIETLCTNGIVDLSKDDIISTFNEDYFNSVLASCLLPNKGMHSILDIDITGLGAGKRQKSKKIKTECIINKWSDSIDIQEELAESCHEQVLRLNGKNVDYVKYLDDLIMGFKQTYTLICKCKTKFFNLACESLSQVSFRQVMRATFIYDKFLKASYRPEYLTGTSQREKVLAIINTRNSNRENEEYLQLMEGDIPYFYSKFELPHLYSGNSVVEENYFRKSIKDELLDYMSKNLNKEDCEKQINLIWNSFRFSYDKQFENPYSNELPILSLENEWEDAQIIVSHIKRLAIWNQTKNKCSFYDVGISADETYKIDILGNGLYGGIGLILFLFVYASRTKMSADMEFAECVLAGFQEQYDKEHTVISTSVFSGLLGHLYMNYILFKQTGRPIFRQNYVRLVESLEAYEGCGQEAMIDIIGGISGLIVVLAQIYRDSKEQRIKKLLTRFSQNLYMYLENNTIALNGFAHGRAGIATALILAGTINNEECYCKKGVELFMVENSFYNQKKKNWKDLRKKGGDGWMWCHGAPGCLLARIICVRFNPGLRAVLLDSYFEASYQKLLSQFMAISEGDCLCHGSFGNLEILHYIGQSGIVDMKMSTAQRHIYFSEIIRRINEKGLSCGVAGARGIVSFMLGISGIGYTLMRCQDQTLPCLLALEV